MSFRTPLDSTTTVTNNHKKLLLIDDNLDCFKRTIVIVYTLAFSLRHQFQIECLKLKLVLVTQAREFSHWTFRDFRKSGNKVPEWNWIYTRASGCLVYELCLKGLPCERSYVFINLGESQLIFQWRCSDVSIVNFEQISHVALVFPLLTQNK